jgi:rubrerythrin
METEEDKEMMKQELEAVQDMEAEQGMKQEEEQEEMEMEEVEKQEAVKEVLKELARRIKENSEIDWDAKNLNRLPSAPEEFGCEICNGKVEQPHPFADKENPGLCNACNELVGRLVAT